MHRRIALSIAHALSLFSLPVVGRDPTARAQQRQRFIADTAVVSYHAAPNNGMHPTAK